MLSKNAFRSGVYCNLMSCQKTFINGKMTAFDCLWGYHPHRPSRGSASVGSTAVAFCLELKHIDKCCFRVITVVVTVNCMLLSGVRQVWFIPLVDERGVCR